MLSSPIPLFVVGMNRSGTKWLSNLLANHPDVASVQADFADGILETNILFPTPRKFSLEHDDDYVAFLKLWSLSDFVQVTGVDVLAFAQANPQPRTTTALFGMLMNIYAERLQKRYWLQKIGPESMEDVVAAFPHARFVTIFRDLADTVHSCHQLLHDQGQHDSLVSTTFGFVLAEKLLQRTSRQAGSLVTTYEALRANPRETLSRVCQHLGLSFRDDLLDVSYEPNSTFRNRAKRPTMPASQRTLVRSVATLLRLLPEGVLRAYAQTRPFARATVPFVPGSFHALSKEILESVQDEVASKG